MSGSVLFIGENTIWQICQFQEIKVPDQSSGWDIFVCLALCKYYYETNSNVYHKQYVLSFLSFFLMFSKYDQTIISPCYEKSVLTSHSS